MPKKIKIKKESAAKTGTFRRKIFTEYEQYEKNIYIRIKTNYFRLRLSYMTAPLSVKVSKLKRAQRELKET